MTLDKTVNPMVSKLTSVLLFFLIFMIDAVFRIRDWEDKSIDFQVVIKLLILVVCFVLGCNSFRYKSFYNRCALMLVFLGLFVISTLYSPTILYSLYISFTYIAIFLFIYHCFVVLGFNEILIQATKVFFIFLLISLALYLFVPELGRYAYWENDIFYTSYRMSGLAGNANHFARLVAIYLIILFFYRELLKTSFSTKFINIQILLAVVCLLLTASRTTMIALIFCIMLFYYLRLNKVNKARLFIVFMVLTTFIYFLFPVFSSYFSRDGGADLTSFTGRTFIWDVTIELIQRRPLFGYGVGSSVTILPLNILDIGFKASHAHNMYLQVLLSVGIIGFGVFFLLIFLGFFKLLKHNNYGMISILVLILFVGFLESAAIALTANMFTIFLFVSLIESNLAQKNKIGNN